MSKLHQKTEIWKPIPGFENYYEISNFSRIRSVERIVKTTVSKFTTGSQTKKSIIMKTRKHTNGYQIIWLTDKDSNRKRLYLHRLIAIVFIPNPDNKNTINHIDGNSSNNIIENLEWCTQAENVTHASSIGLLKPPTEDRVQLVRNVIKLKDFGMGLTAIARVLEEKITLIRPIYYENNYKYTIKQLRAGLI